MRPRRTSPMLIVAPRRWGQQEGRGAMPRAYFDHENMKALTLVFQEAKTILEMRGLTGPNDLDFVAQRILRLASDGLEPPLILAHVLQHKRPALETGTDDNVDASPVILEDLKR